MHENHSGASNEWIPLDQCLAITRMLQSACLAATGTKSSHLRAHSKGQDRYWQVQDAVESLSESNPYFSLHEVHLGRGKFPLNLLSASGNIYGFFKTEDPSTPKLAAVKRDKFVSNTSSTYQPVLHPEFTTIERALLHQLPFEENPQLSELFRNNEFFVQVCFGVEKDSDDITHIVAYASGTHSSEQWVYDIFHVSESHISELAATPGVQITRPSIGLSKKQVRKDDNS